jgi:hypothetical protein
VDSLQRGRIGIFRKIFAYRYPCHFRVGHLLRRQLVQGKSTLLEIKKLFFLLNVIAYGINGDPSDDPDSLLVDENAARKVHKSS